MKTNFMQKVHFSKEVADNFISFIVKENNWILYIKKGGFNLNFFSFVKRRYK